LPDLRPVFFVIGVMLAVLAGAMLLPVVADLAHGNRNWKVFGVSAGITAFFGGGTILACRQPHWSMDLRQAFLLTTLSWVVIAALYMYGEYLQIERFTTPSEAGMLAALSATLFFGGVLLHEIAHAVVARAFDVPVAGITLVFWGGATETRANAKGPLVEFLISAAGPGSTLLLAGIFSAIANGMDPGLARAVIHDLAWLNLIFAAFNALPGFPLDGGRMVLATTWGITHRRRLALQVAGWSGVVVGGGMIAYGVLQLTDGGRGVWGIWLAFIGFTLFATGWQMPQRIALRDEIGDATVADAMRPPLNSVPATASLTQALDHVLRDEPTRAFPVTEAGRVIGTISMDSARRVGGRDPLRPVRDATRPLTTTPVLAPEDPLVDALEWLGGRDGMVLRDGALVGALAPVDVEAWYKRLHEPAGTVPPRPDR
jgi:Zn-dependent protease